MARGLFIIGMSLLCLSCGDENKSQLSFATHASTFDQAPIELQDSLWQSASVDTLTRDFYEQRQMGWRLWADLLRTIPSRQTPNLMVWQSWYGIEDLKIIFRHLYERLGRVGRHERRAFTETEIMEALQWNSLDSSSKALPAQQRWERWLDGLDLDEKRSTVGSMEKILFNKEALLFIVRNYQRLELCAREKQAGRDCLSLSWPVHTVFLKTAWRRSEEGFLVDSFATDAKALAMQWGKPQWTRDEAYEPLADQSYFIRSRTGQKFHLVGLHASAKFDERWFWTSFWLGKDPQQDYASDQPQDWSSPWQNYRQCSIFDWSQPLREQDIDPQWPKPIGELAEKLKLLNPAHWCSNPYLEVGVNNQKTQCIGCHQYAGFDWSGKELNRRLQDNLPSLLAPGEQQGPTDAIWSLFSGPSPLIFAVLDSIDYFDVYDPYQ